MMRKRREKGMALLLVLVVIALLTTLLTELAFTTLVDLRLTETFRDSTRAYYLARGGVSAGRMLLQEDRNKHDSRDETWSQGIVNYPVGEGTVSIDIQDLDGKLAINELVKGNNPQTLVIDRFYRFFQALGIEHLADPAELTAALIDWLDQDDDPYQVLRSGDVDIPVAGAEELYYQGRQKPYPCKNGPLETLEELQLVRGFSPELLEIAAPHLTVNGNVQININTASDKVLMSLDLLIDEQIAEILIAYRQATPIETISELEDILPAEIYSILKSLANQKTLGTTSSFYRITSHARINDGNRKLVAEVDKQDNSLLFIKVD
jgi:general secretion pathway protein K